MSLYHSATHRGAPFAGRRRETGLLVRLIEDGLSGTCPLVAVCGPPGVGRRRLVQEALRRGPEAEWVHLAPGDVGLDIPFWARTELDDLLEAYPDAPYPEWALHVLSTWVPSVRARLENPPRMRARVDPAAEPERVGAAVGAVLRALTGQVPVLVDAGLWPRGGPNARLAGALCEALATPGCLVLAAASPETSPPSDARVLELAPFRLREVEELVAAWSEGRGHARVARWLHRVSGGHAFHIQETVRWLEEGGFARVDEEAGRVSFHAKTADYLVPFNLDAVLEARYLRLPVESKRLLHLIAQHDGAWDMETLRARFHPDELEFDAAFTPLRRRAFLLQRNFRRPVALSSPLWGTFVEGMVERFTRYRWKAPKRTARAVVRPEASSASQCLHQVDAAQRLADPAEHRKVLAQAIRTSRGRPGSAWRAVEARLFVLRARDQLRRERAAAASRVCRAGLRVVDPDRFPRLRAALHQDLAEALSRLGQWSPAQEVRTTAAAELQRAGLAERTARVQAAAAEGARRLGRLAEAERLAAAATETLAEQGQTRLHGLALYTQARAICDAGRLSDAARLVERHALAAPLHDVAARIQANGPVPRVDSHVPDGWGWGLDHDAGPDDLPSETDAWELRCRELAHDWEALDLTFKKTAALCHVMGARARLRRIAEAHLELPPGACPTFDRVFRPLLLRGVHRPALPKAEPVVWTLLGRVHILRDGVEIPGGLWPEWIRRLVAEAVSAELLRNPLSAEEAKALLAEAAAPEGGVAELLREATRFLVGQASARGGLQLAGEVVVVDWHGITCDALALWTLLHEPPRSHEHADTLRERANTYAGAVFMPGDDSPRVRRLRQVFQTASPASPQAQKLR